ncbi:MAG: 50S ribosomal protein L25/general stress protein Ctc [Gammaproteobacteria bacterium]|nr:50S ribosomal protein L25/general stress protein Ctc [Gammaproteobacteria bacterium]NND54784.1 50S ribosomal protein L25/general stress protein Ctc [Gammaproteobacteria bacterium]
MVQAFNLVAEYREDTGKGSSRRLRHAGKVPAIIYGAGREPRALTFDHNDLLRAAENEAFMSSVLTVKVGPNERSTIIKDIQVHPAKRQILHIDLQRIVDDEEIRMEVPLHYINEEGAPGVKAGGSISKIFVEVEVECLPKYLPEYLEVDVGAMELDDMLHLSDIKTPEGVTLTALAQEPPADETICSLHVMRVAEEPEETDEAEEDAADDAAADEAKDESGEEGGSED